MVRHIPPHSWRSPLQSRPLAALGVLAECNEPLAGCDQRGRERKSVTDTDLVTAGDSIENDKLSDSVTPETSSETDARSSASDGSLATMVLPELRALANRSGVKGTSGMRKSELIAAIRATRQGGHANGASPNGGAGGESEDNRDTKVANSHSDSAVEDAPRSDSGERPSSG